MAFHKGIDYFTEIFFFYGLVFGIAFYEMAKSVAATNFAKATQLNLVANTAQLQKDVEDLKQENAQLMNQLEDMKRSSEN